MGATEEVTILDLARKVPLASECGGRHDTCAGRIVLVPYDQAYEAGFEDMRRRVPSIRKITAAIGWEPEIPLEQTLRQIILSLR